MRRYFEELELQSLENYAVKSAFSLGRLHKEPPCENRTCFQRDRDRVIHSKAFRRLQYKTQVFIITESDHFRSRLTHSLEVASISRHLCRLLKLNEDLAETIALSHDLGHTPFGHSGERSLNKVFKENGGFEHNRQSRRIVEIIESKYPEFDGLNLSKEVLDGLLKHKTPWEEKEKIQKLFLSLEAQVVNLADEIAYHNHDIDDGLSSGILSEKDIEKESSLFANAKSNIQKKYPILTEKKRRHMINSYLISSLIQDVYETSLQNIQTKNIHTLKDIQKVKTPLITLSKDMAQKTKELKAYLFRKLYTHPTVHKMNKKGQHIIETLATTYLNDSKLLPLHIQEKIKQDGLEQSVKDYVSGMTDRFAIKEYEELTQF